MSTATELTRISNAKAAIRTSIENKGVTVPAADLIDTYSQYIDAISTATPTQAKSVTIDSNTVTTIRPDTGYDLSEVTVTTAVPGGSSAVEAVGKSFLYCASNQTGSDRPSTYADFVLDLSGQTFTSYKGLYQGCYNVKLPSTCTRIESGAFAGIGFVWNNRVDQYRPLYIDIPDSVTYIGKYAFYEPDAFFPNQYGSGELPVKAIRFGSDSHLTTLDEYAFSHGGITGTFSFSESLTSIGKGCFYDNPGLTSIEFILCTHVTSIPDYCFRSCTGLNRLSLPPNITSIGQYAFSATGTNSLSLTIPASVTTIADYSFSSFSSSYNRKTIHFRSTVPPTLGGANVFGFSAGSVNIYVPYSDDHSILNAYKTAQYWSRDASYIFEEAAPTP